MLPALATIIVALLTCAGSASAAPSISEYSPLPNADSQPSGVTAGPDGRVWFTEANSTPSSDHTGRVGAMTPAGGLAEFGLPTSGSAPSDITAGSDGALWATEAGVDHIARITTAGAVTEYPHSGTSGTITSGGAPNAIAAGPDGALWFTEGGYNQGNRIGRIDPGSGAISEYCIGKCNLPSLSSDAGWLPTDIVAGPGGQLWFTEQNPARGPSYVDPYGDAGTGYIVSMSTAGKVTNTFKVPNDAQPYGITVGADGALWFTERQAGKIGRITTAGAITEYAVPTPFSQPTAITAAHDGAIWFLESAANQIGVMDTTGKFLAEYPIPTSASLPGDIAPGPDGNLYFSEVDGNRLGQVGIGSAPPPPSIPGPQQPKPPNYGPISTDNGSGDSGGVIAPTISGLGASFASYVIARPDGRVVVPRVTVGCPSNDDPGCFVRVQLTTLVPAAGGRGPGTDVTIGSAYFPVEAGETSSVTILLSAPGRAVLTRLTTIRAFAEISAWPVQGKPVARAITAMTLRAPVHGFHLTKKKAKPRRHRSAAHRKAGGKHRRGRHGAKK